MGAQLALWKTQVSGIHPFYAVKCNPEPLLLNTLYDAGVSFDCASEAELLAVRDLARGTAAARIVYANPSKSVRDLGAAKELGAPVTVVDSVEEVEKLAATRYEGGALVRMATDDSAARMPFSTKFGAAPAEVPRIADAARALRLPLLGVSFHVGSGCSSGSAYVDAVRGAYFGGVLKLREAGHKGAGILDIGGGFLPDEEDLRKKAMAIRGVKMEIDYAEKDRTGGPLAGPRGGLRWIAEPGRYFAAGAMDFFVQVIGKKPATGLGPSVAGGAPRGWKYTLDDSLYGQFSSILFDYQTPSWVRVRLPGEKPRAKSAGVLFGRTCDSVDVIAAADEMEELAVGDWLWFPRMGAYTRATASEFNGFPRPSVMVAADLPEVGEELRDREMWHAQPTGLTYMPPVSARSFWASMLRGGKH